MWISYLMEDCIMKTSDTGKQLRACRNAVLVDKCGEHAVAIGILLAEQYVSA